MVKDFFVFFVFFVVAFEFLSLEFGWKDVGEFAVKIAL
jgi:hypothetical protein